MKLVLKYPVFFSIVLIALIILGGRVFNAIFEINQDLKKIVFNIVIIISLYFFIYSKQTPFKLFNRLNYKELLYYLPIILYVYVFSGGFSDFCKLDFDDFSKKEIIIYTSKIYFSAFFEEVLFRGVILGILLFKFKNSNNSILKSVFITSLLFGSTHIINIWFSEMTPRGVFNQVYATFSLGFLYSAVYLKTKNIYMLIFIHFITNFFSQIGILETTEITRNVIEYVNKTKLQLILSELIRLIIFGIPLFIAIVILNSISKKEVSMFDR